MRHASLIITSICLGLAAITFARSVGAAEQEPAAGTGGVAPKLAFVLDGKEFRFDTGLLQGTLRPQGRSLGLGPAVDSTSRATLTGGAGLFSHYRLLDAEARYGGGAWDWPSQARGLADASVAATWSSDPGHPFDMTAVYRWKSPNALDVVTSVTARKDLERFEVFLASYFSGFAESLVYVKNSPATARRPGLLPATRANGDWQMFPRDDAAVKIIQDGRWKRPPNPVQWKIMPPLAGPLAVRRDAKTGLTALVMAPPEDCFAVATPYGEEGHRSLYLSLLGRDLKTGQTAQARSRLVVGRDISNEQAIAIYQGYLEEAQSLAK